MGRPRNFSSTGGKQRIYANSGFRPAPGTDYTQGDEPVIASRLDKLANYLHVTLIGISGYRTPKHSVEVGGFADDPHTRGEASDTDGAQSITEKVLEKFGLTRPFSGAQEANHIQLFHGTSNAAPVSGGTVSGTGGNTPAGWLKAAGWPAALIPTMVAIGGAESGWNVNATNTNTNGTTDDGWLQINSIHGFDRDRLRSDPLYTAAAALKIYQSQGLAAWVTYNTGAFKHFLGDTPRVRNFSGSTSTTGKTRPGGDDPGAADDGPDEVTQVLSDWTDARDGTAADGNQFTSFNPLPLLPGVGPLFGGLGALGALPSPSSLSKALSGSVHDAKDFFKVLIWIINPANILRMVEFLAGLLFMGFGFQAMLQAYGEGKEGFSTSENAVSRSGLGRVSREIAAAATTAAAPEAKVAKAAAAAGAGDGGGGKKRSRLRIKPAAAPHRTRRQALRLRYDREKQVSQRRTVERRAG